MTWPEFHRMSEELAAAAETALRERSVEEAVALYRQAAEAEARALDALDVDKRRTLGITAVSAIALHYKAHAYAEAEALAYRWLPHPNLPSFARHQIRELLQLTWAAATSDEAIRFAPGDVLVSVKGGDVVYGGAPLDLIVQKVSEVEKLFYRVTEYVLGKPHRVRGEASREIREIARPWLFQATPGSYQFMVRVQEPAQPSLFEPRPDVAKVASTFLNVVRASASDPDGTLAKLVPDPDYRRTFLKMTRNLAPTGKRFERIDIRDATESPNYAISLAAPIRSEINASLNKQREVVGTGGGQEVRQVRGVLRAVHLDHQWLEVSDPNDPSRHTRIERTSEALDDIIGPMVNHPVVVDTVVDKRGHHRFHDIQFDE